MPTRTRTKRKTRTTTKSTTKTVQKKKRGKKMTSTLNVDQPTPRPDAERQGKYLTRRPDGFASRLKKAKTQKLFLVDIQPIVTDSSGDPHRTFLLLGATGNKYTITIGPDCRCSCVDFIIRKKCCKHITFVKLKVLKISEENPLLWNRFLATEELEDIFQFCTKHIASGIFAPVKVRAAIAHDEGATPYLLEGENLPSEKVEENSVQRKDFIGNGTECPICVEIFEAETVDEPITWCKSCGLNIHSNCMQMWFLAKEQNGGKKTCPFCRAEWKDVSGHTKTEQAIKKVGSETVAFYRKFQNYSGILENSDEASTSTASSSSS